MILLDVNVLLYAFLEDLPEHPRYRDWLVRTVSSNEPFGLSDIVLSAVVRIATNPRISNPPASAEDAFAFVRALRSAPNATILSPGERHWAIFERLCHETMVRGPHVTDAYLAALAIETGSEWITTDRDFARFPGLRWRHPLAA